jgi:hypothetical protein
MNPAEKLCGNYRRGKNTIAYTNTCNYKKLKILKTTNSKI